MEYSVRLAPHAIVQIQEAVSYISKVLNEPNTANSWADYLQKEINKLDSMPARFPLVENEKWAAKGIRKFPVKTLSFITILMKIVTQYGLQLLFTPEEIN